MDPQRWTRVRAIVEGACELDRDPQARARFVQAQCAGDAELLAEVESLLAAESSACLEPPSAERVGAALRGSTERDAQSACGTRAGPYELERVLGIGGMGVVYLARRVGVDFEQRVALKLIKRGMDTDEVVRRFRHERAVLASLQHAGIARLFDGGSTDDGRPWLAMEWVEGREIRAWCDERRCGIEQRVDLFLLVCAAVAFAHKNLVVHRDIKPSNILVTSEGIPKLLDFGLAKLLLHDGPEQRELTQPGQRALTPAYASPEQLRGAPLTSATDIYSLGLVLYELLCGAQPFAGAQHAERGEARRPSTVVSEAVALARSSDVRRLRRALAGDLETVVLTALEPEPERRYPTVDAFAADLERYRRGLPIEARPATTLYRMGKFAARHRVGVGAAVLVMLSLVGGLAASLRAWGAAETARARERDERKLAEQRGREAVLAARRAESALDIVHGMFGAVAELDADEPDRTVRALLDDFDERWSAAPSIDPEVEASVRETMGAAYLSLGLAEKARPHLERASDLAGDSEAGRQIARRARIGLVRVATSFAQYAAAAAAADELERELRAHSPMPAEELSEVLRYRAQIRAQLGEFELARADAEAAVELLRRESSDPRGEVGALAVLGQCCAKAADFVAAEVALRQALAVHARLGAPDTLGTAAVRHELASVLLQSSRYEEARSLTQGALEVRRKIAGPRTTLVGESLGLLGRIATEEGRFDEALPLLEESLSIALERLPRVHPNTASAMSRLADALRSKRDLARALPLYRDAYEIRRELYGDGHPVATRSLGNLGLALLESGALEQAEPLLRRAVEQRRATPGDEAGLAASLQSLGRLLSEQGKFEEQIAVEQEGLAIRRRLVPADDAGLASALIAHAYSLQSAKRFDEGLAALREAVELRRGVFGERSPRYARVRSDLGAALLVAGRFEQAIAELTSALALQRQLLSPTDPDIALTLERLASSLRSHGTPEVSIEHWQAALDILDSSLGPTHARTKRVAERYAVTLREVGRDGEAARIENLYLSR